MNISSKSKCLFVFLLFIFNVPFLALAVQGTSSRSNPIQPAGPIPASSVLPANPTVVSGNVSMTNPNYSTLDVNISSSGLSQINWGIFNIGLLDTVNFQQYNASSVVLNRVTGNNQSVISGVLNSNGNVWLINPSGILINSTAQINVGGLLAAAGNDNFSFDQDAFNLTNSVVNNGSINIQNPNGGYAALMGTSVQNNGSINFLNNHGNAYLDGNLVSNTGSITANFGSINLVAGTNPTVAIDPSGDISVNVRPDSCGSNCTDQVLNTGLLQANGGDVNLQAFINNVSPAYFAVNTTGIIMANSLDNVNGRIVLDSADSGSSMFLGGTISGTSVETDSGYNLYSTANISTANNYSVDLPGSFQQAGGSINVTGPNATIDITANNDIDITSSSLNSTASNGEAMISLESKYGNIGLAASTITSQATNGDAWVNITSDNGNFNMFPLTLDNPDPSQDSITATGTFAWINITANDNINIFYAQLESQATSANAGIGLVSYNGNTNIGSTLLEARTFNGNAYEFLNNDNGGINLYSGLLNVTGGYAQIDMETSEDIDLNSTLLISQNYNGIYGSWIAMSSLMRGINIISSVLDNTAGNGTSGIRLVGDSGLTINSSSLNSTATNGDARIDLENKNGDINVETSTLASQTTNGDAWVNITSDNASFNMFPLTLDDPDPSQNSITATGTDAWINITANDGINIFYAQLESQATSGDAGIGLVSYNGNTNIGSALLEAQAFNGNAGLSLVNYNGGMFLNNGLINVVGENAQINIGSLDFVSLNNSLINSLSNNGSEININDWSGSINLNSSVLYSDSNNGLAGIGLISGGELVLNSSTLNSTANNGSANISLESKFGDINIETSTITSQAANGDATVNITSDNGSFYMYPLTDYPDPSQNSITATGTDAWINITANDGINIFYAQLESQATSGDAGIGLVSYNGNTNIGSALLEVQAFNGNAGLSLVNYNGGMFLNNGLINVVGENAQINIGSLDFVSLNNSLINSLSNNGSEININDWSGSINLNSSVLYSDSNNGLAGIGLISGGELVLNSSTLNSTANNGAANISLESKFGDINIETSTITSQATSGDATVNITSDNGSFYMYPLTDYPDPSQNSITATGTDAWINITANDGINIFYAQLESQATSGDAGIGLVSYNGNTNIGSALLEVQAFNGNANLSLSNYIGGENLNYSLFSVVGENTQVNIGSYEDVDFNSTLLNSFSNNGSEVTINDWFGAINLTSSVLDSTSNNGQAAIALMSDNGMTFNTSILNSTANNGDAAISLESKYGDIELAASTITSQATNGDAMVDIRSDNGNFIMYPLTLQEPELNNSSILATGSNAWINITANSDIDLFYSLLEIQATNGNAGIALSTENGNINISTSLLEGESANGGVIISFTNYNGGGLTGENIGGTGTSDNGPIPDVQSSLNVNSSAITQILSSSISSFNLPELNLQPLSLEADDPGAAILSFSKVN